MSGNLQGNYKGTILHEFIFNILQRVNELKYLSQNQFIKIQTYYTTLTTKKLRNTSLVS